MPDDFIAIMRADEAEQRGAGRWQSATQLPHVSDTEVWFTKSTDNVSVDGAK